MSKILKTMWSKSDKRSKQRSETNISIAIQQEANPRPFEIDLKTMWKYDNEELVDFIVQYEQFINELRKKYQDMSEEYPVLKEKILLDDMERKRLTEELEQYKLQCENLKAAMEQKTNTRPGFQKSLSNYVAKSKVSESETTRKAVEAENKNQLEEIRKEFEFKQSELKTQINEQAKTIEDLINQNHSLENHKTEMEGQLSALTLDLAELRKKLEHSEIDLELSNELNVSLRGLIVNSAAEGESKGQMESFNKIIIDLEKSKASLNEELRNALNDQKQKESQHQLEISNLKLSVNSMKDETERLQKALLAKEARALDLENKLIQERLKVDQIKRDLTKAEESYKETKVHLNEQITKNHELLKMLECRENDLVDMSKKYREIKKNLKKTELQLTKVQNELQDEQAQRVKLEQVMAEQKTESTQNDETDRSPKFGDDQFTVYGLSSEVRSLRGKIDLVTAEAEALKEENKTLNKLLNDERKELELLKEKREAGVNEIKRLNMLIENGKASRSNSKSNLRASGSDLGHLNVISAVKKTLESLYKQFIISVQYEKSFDSDYAVGAKSLRSTVQGVIPPDGVVRLEKSLNDAIFFVREYLESTQ